MEEKTNSQKAVLLGLSGWVLSFVTMLVVKGGDVGQALSSLLVIMTTACVAATAIAIAMQKRKVDGA